MKIPTEGKLLRIFVGEADRWHGKPLYQAIVEEARTRGLAGATVLKGFIGFGAHSRLHTSTILRLSTDLPVVVEIVDAVEKIEAFLPTLDEMGKKGSRPSSAPKSSSTAGQQRRGSSHEDAKSTKPGSSHEDPKSTKPGSSHEDAKSTKPGSSHEDPKSTTPGSSHEDPKSTTPGSSYEDPKSTKPGYTRSHASLARQLR